MTYFSTVKSCHVSGCMIPSVSSATCDGKAHTVHDTDAFVYELKKTQSYCMR